VSESREGDPAPASLPRLAFVYHPRSFAALSIAESARGLCELVWLVDTSDSRVGSTARLLARLGTVVDIAGRSAQEAAPVVAAHGVDGILALADDLLGWTAALAHDLGLPFLSQDAARLLTDKFEQRSAFRAAGLAAPGSWVVNAGTDDDGWATVAREAGFPVVLKPRKGEGSRNTVLLESVDEVRAVVTESAELPGEAGRDWVIEEYIADIDFPVFGEGFANYVSVESFVVAGAVGHLAINGRTPPAAPFRETGFFIPAAVEAALADQLRETAGRAILALGATIGCFHTEIKLTPSGPVIIEVNGRIGGGVPELIQLTTGKDFLAVALRVALGIGADVGHLDFKGVAYLLYVPVPDNVHRITSVEGLDKVKALEGVADVMLNRGAGEVVDWRDGNHGHVFSVLGVVDDYDDLRAVIERVSELAQIDGE
jgi:biotin carboxylase